MLRLKAVKIRKTDLKKTPEDFLRKVGAVNEELKRAYPEHVFMAKEDYALLKKNLARKYRKEIPYISKRRLQNSVGMHLLNCGPSEILDEGVRPGYVLVDVEGIKLQEQLDRDVEAAEDHTESEPLKTDEAGVVPVTELPSTSEPLQEEIDPTPKKSLLDRVFSFLGE
jgi:hypothetical protein